MLVDVTYIHPKTKEEKLYQDANEYGDEAHVIYWYIEGDGNINCNRASIFGIEEDLTEEEIDALWENDDFLQVEVTKITNRETGKIVWPELLDKYPNLDKAGFKLL
jgi:hypothetical protein